MIKNYICTAIITLTAAMASAQYPELSENQISEGLRGYFISTTCLVGTPNDSRFQTESGGGLWMKDDAIRAIVANLVARIRRNDTIRDYYYETSTCYDSNHRSGIRIQVNASVR